MANANSKISWTDSTINFVTGCSRVSEGCRACYAERLSLQMHKRWVAMGKTPEQIRHAGFTALPWTSANASENVICHWDRLEIPLKWKQPKKIFINSMSDWLHPLVPIPFIDAMLEVMMACHWHTFQSLTKRPENMERMLYERQKTRQCVLLGAATIFIICGWEPALKTSVSCTG